MTSAFSVTHPALTSGLRVICPSEGYSGSDLEVSAPAYALSLQEAP